MVSMQNGVGSKFKAVLVQQGVWDMPLESLPLASAYMKATALDDPVIAARCEVEIANFKGGMSNAAMANSLFGSSEQIDVLAFSVLGWNYASFGALAATYKQINPDGWVVFGGTHVSNQAQRVFDAFPAVDIVVNGEGEFTFKDILLARINAPASGDFESIDGISFVQPSGQVVTTQSRERIEDLNLIPSPFLTGAIELTDASGDFKYDVALMETNRGCPYKCSFCYWGGAVGQKVRAFSIERLTQELELFARLKVHTIVACDANFGMLPADLEFVKAMIAMREKYGFPRALETSWAKNKSNTFYQIVKLMKDAGIKTSFTLALQTLNDEALGTMNRRNMKVNDWEDLVEWLDHEGLDCYAELIWGAPGETVESFMEGYDRLSRHVSRIAVYPMLLLPNTTYMERKEDYGIVSIRGDSDDFEYVLSHNTMTFEDNQRMQRFMFWARVVAENAVLRHSWVALRTIGGLAQSKVLQNLDSWIASVDDPAAVPLRGFLSSALGGTDAYGAAITYLFADDDADRLLMRWWIESIEPLLPEKYVEVLREIFRYDLLTRPLDDSGQFRESETAPAVEIVEGEDYYVRYAEALQFDVAGLIADMRAGRLLDLSVSPTVVDLLYRVGSGSAIRSTNHEIIVHFMGRTREEVLAPTTGASLDVGNGVEMDGMHGRKQIPLLVKSDVPMESRARGDSERC